MLWSQFLIKGTSNEYLNPPIKFKKEEEKERMP